jgi:hypothetical protein
MKSKPRLAEDAESLWNAIKSLEKRLTSSGWVFPVINVVGVGTFTVSKDGKLTRIEPSFELGIYLNGYVRDSLADEVHDAINKDQVQVEYWPRMHSLKIWAVDSVVHSPSGFSFGIAPDTKSRGNSYNVDYALVSEEEIENHHENS